MKSKDVFLVRFLVILAVTFSVADLTGENIDVDENNVKYITEKITDQPLVTVSKRFIPNPNDKCLKGGSYRYCTESEDYPIEHIRSKLIADSKKYFKLVTPKLRSTVPASATPSLNHHVSSQNFDSDIVSYSAPTIFHNRRHYQEKSIIESLCLNTRSIMYLKMAKNRNDDLKFVVNQDNFTQAVEIEECIDAGSSCQMTDSFPIGYRSECKQHHSLRVLLSLNSDGEIIPDLFPLPSCCKCVLHREFISDASYKK